jgi:hypothetical protein
MANVPELQLYDGSVSTLSTSLGLLARELSDRYNPSRDKLCRTANAFSQLEHTMSQGEHTTNWPDLAIGLYDRLTGRNAEISYEFQDMHVKIPSGTGPEAQHAEWVFSGKLSICTRNSDAAPN